MKSEKLLFLSVCLFVVIWFVSLNIYELFYSNQTVLLFPDERVKTQFNEWKNCIMKNISVYNKDANGLWSHLWRGVGLCEKLPFMASLAIQNFSNSDEIKRHILPLQNELSVIVTMGIGYDIAAEEALLRVLPNSTFYGVDPISEKNEELYTRFGTFFPFAIGSKSKVSRASVLVNDSYVDRNVVHIEFVYFLSTLLGHMVYDDIWIDIEGAEYELFPYFYRDGELDRNGITVCQFNMEVHSPDDSKKEMFREFIFRILNDNRAWPVANIAKDFELSRSRRRRPRI